MEDKRERYSVSQVTQGNHKFFMLTMPSDVLADCCFVSSRYNDPKEGFQRQLDEKRAHDIANYIDKGLGTIPSAIVLSAQAEAELKLIGRGKTIEFRLHPKAFLILDGQHRVYGFQFSKSNLRVPVVVYNNLTRRDESRLFIDINSKQRGVSNELLLDIKKLAEYEGTTEAKLRSVFDRLNAEPLSPLMGKMSAYSKSSQKISRVTFNSAYKPLMELFDHLDNDAVFEIICNYLTAFYDGLKSRNIETTLTNAIVFRAVSAIFRNIASKVKDKHGPDYTIDNFYEAMEEMFPQLKESRLNKPGNSYKALQEHFEACLKTTFRL